MNDSNFAALVSGFLIGILLSALAVLLIAPSHEESWKMNVCEYEGGTLHGDVCIVDDRVFEIPKEDS